MNEFEKQVAEAIDIITESRRTHIEWSKFFELCPEHQETVKDTVHDKAGQDEIIEEYNKVLKVLEAVKEKGEVYE